MKRTLKWIPMLLVIAMLAACLAGCGSSNTGSNTQANTGTAVSGYPTAEEIGKIDGLYDSLTIAVFQSIDHLKPWGGTGQTKSYFYWNIYETLYDLDSKNKLVPDLACDQPIKVDDVTWDIPLYHTIKDWNGNNITAHDVVAAYDRVISIGESLNYDQFESAEALDDYTVRIHWKNKPAFAEYENPLCRTFIYFNDTFDDQLFATKPIGTGNYRIISYTTGSNITLWADPNYWALVTDEDVSARSDLHTATVQSVTYDIISEASSAVSELSNGNIDYCDFIKQAEQIASFENDARYATTSNITPDYYFVSCNLFPGKLTTDVNLRKAIYYALDNNVIAQFMGASWVGCKSIGDTGFIDFNPAWENEETYVNTYDPDLAKQYLAQSSYDGTPLVLSYQVGEEVNLAAQVIQSQLANVGITCTIDPIDNSLFNTKTTDPNNFDMILFRMGGPNLIGSYKLAMSGVNTAKLDVVTAQYAPDSVYTLTFIQDEQLFALHAKAQETDADEDIKALIDYVIENGYETAIAYSATNYVYNADIAELYFHETYVTPQCFTFK